MDGDQLHGGDASNGIGHFSRAERWADLGSDSDAKQEEDMDSHASPDADGEIHGDELPRDEAFVHTAVTIADSIETSDHRPHLQHPEELRRLAGAGRIAHQPSTAPEDRGADEDGFRPARRGRKARRRARAKSTAASSTDAPPADRSEDMR